MAKLVVLLGAGASYDCTSNAVQTDPELRPPLVKDLFASHLRTAMILNSYPLAEMAAAEMRSLEPKSFVLEEYLRTKLRGSEDVYAQLRYRQIPLFLQDLFFTISQKAKASERGLLGYTRHADNYDVLLNLTLPLEKVVLHHLELRHPFRQSSSQLWALTDRKHG
jgi:hypothetical protein